MTVNITLIYFDSGLTAFIKQQISDWTKALTDLEGRFLACEEIDEANHIAPPKKRPRNSKSKPSYRKEICAAMTELAASLHVNYYQKVCY